MLCYMSDKINKIKMEFWNDHLHFINIIAIIDGDDATFLIVEDSCSKNIKWDEQNYM